MNRIETTFSALKDQGRKALITFTMAGDPDVAKSQSLLETLASSGADIIEIGMPFTDPMADGPAIQAAGLRALGKGMTLKKTISMVQQFRSKNTKTPIVLMGYFNPILSYGVDAFMKDAAASGVDGLIIVDIPPEEASEINQQVQQNNLCLIRLITPTTDEKRLSVILKGSSGFLYYVSIAGVTGTKSADADTVSRHIESIRTQTSLPLAVGFGIRTPADVAVFSKMADAVVVGSAIVQNIEQNQNDNNINALIGDQVKSLANAL